MLQRIYFRDRKIIMQNNNEILDRAINQNGALNQCDMMVEEAAELVKELGGLIQSLNKLKRKGGITDIGIKVPTDSDSIEYCLAYNNLCSEVVDVRILITQMEKMLRKEQLDLIEDRKLQRLKTRLLNNIK